MKIITINVPDSYIAMMQKIVGEDKIYPSRSELIRIALREFLQKELEAYEQYKLFVGAIKVGEPEIKNIQHPPNQVVVDGKMYHIGRRSQ